ncbi:Outer membrane protein assembly factor BamB, contains PQQ-like beta-propeller repeat [Singulisphaera sp. GP187]|uniref:PQQ-binding-like beta-propeller repeat protein n=1 Tax=Singulisphaera sp. GP187 TaxID=1882752 RepID=UPI00092C2F8E|nr:PQQ-binding-like beta-propeller repeat protein [Singulisphaera sp. GP187]SIO35021.1 Outer membrane protein assembly factor BamB, contains PQQ-like beta-propeller repeat [Singulisphaera sp. GP187]
MRELLRALPRRLQGDRPVPRRRAFRPGAESLELRQLLATDVLTYHNDNARTGQNLSEGVLNAATLNPGSFGKLFSYPVDGDIYAQPLYDTGVLINRTLHDVVYVATTHGSVYAFDATSNLGPNAGPLWATSLINPAAGVTTVTGSDLDTTNFTELGIVGTPVIDKASGTLYVDVMTKVNTTSGPLIEHRLHALDITTGQEKFGGPVAVQATVPGTGDGGDTVTFNASKQLQRSALLLNNGVLYVAFASFNNVPYHGWLMAYNASNLQPVGVFCVTPNSRQGSIWMSGGGPAADGSGNVYVATANGKFSGDTGGSDYGDSVLRLVTGSNGLQMADYYSPSNQQLLDSQDQDLGSGGVVLLPNQAGGALPLMVAADKNGTIYLLNRDNLGGFHSDSDQIVHKTAAGTIGILNSDSNLWLGAYSTPAYYNNKLYYAAPGDSLKAFPVAGGQIADAPESVSSNKFTYPGSTPSISANGTIGGIVWVLENGETSAVLRAYDASNVANELYNSQMSGARDQLGSGVKFATPTVADSKVFVGGHGQLTVFGDLRSAYVNAQRSLWSQGFKQNQVYLMLGSSPNFVWHPATPALTRLLDQQAKNGLPKPMPKPRRGPIHPAGPRLTSPRPIRPRSQ